ncbi:hypothetical protein CSQ96_00170 [Janthinobacterium sp. BJB412]|nr:hypothetical protein CSQ96_00170 [Janthinobacterium sp. BJB412]
MNIAKNMEAIFVSAAVLIGATSLATAAVPAHRAAAPAAARLADAGKIQVVTVSAKRLTSAQKAALVD